MISLWEINQMYFYIRVNYIDEFKGKTEAFMNSLAWYEYKNYSIIIKLLTRNIFVQVRESELEVKTVSHSICCFQHSGDGRRNNTL
jgi:predicted transcriptional regulator